MPEKTACIRCHKTGLVRFENVIKGGVSERHYYCGGCNYSWAVTTDGESKEHQDEPPDRSRNR